MVSLKMGGGPVVKKVQDPPSHHVVLEVTGLLSFSMGDVNLAVWLFSSNII